MKMANVRKAKQVAAYKKEIVKKLADLIKKSHIIGSVNMENLPAAQLQKMRAQLRGKVELLMTKRRLMKLAIEQAKAEKKGIEQIEEHLTGMPALLFTDENPFKLFKTLKKSKTKAPAKPGQVAPSDIVIKAGPTSFAPGPVIGELGALGLKTKVDAGKVTILEDAVVCKEGGEISPQLAGMLTRLGIEPMEVGLNIVAVYEDGEIFTKSVLDIDEEKFIADLNQAARWAFNLSCEAAYVTDMNKELLLQKAYLDAKALALSQAILADAVVEELLSKAARQMLSLKSLLPEMPEVKVEEKPKEEKVEEKKEEPKPEAPKVEEKLTKEKPKEEVKVEEPKVEEKAPEPVKEEKVEEKEKPKVEEEEVKEEKIPEPVEKPAKEKPKVEEKKEVIVEKKEPQKAEKKVEKPKKEEIIVEKKEKVEPVEKIEKEPEKVVEEKKEQPKVEEKEEPKPEKAPTAEKIIEEVEKEVEKEPAVQAQKKQEEEKAKRKEVEELAQKLLKKGSLRDVDEEKKKKPKKKKKKSKEEKSDVEKVEELTKQLMKKGTLRK